MNNIKSFFSGLGLNAKEQAIFFSLIKLGRAGVMEIGKDTGFKRSTVYYLLDQLIARGLAIYVMSGNRRIYTPASPQRIKKMISERKEEAEYNLHAFSSLLPELSVLYGQFPNKPKLIYHEGQLGLQEIFEDMLRLPGSEILYFGEVSTFEEALGKKFLQGFVRERVARKIRARAVWTKRTEVSSYLGNPEHLRRVRYAPDWFGSPVAVFIYGNRVSFISSAKESFGVIIESTEFNTTLKNWFEVLWQVSTEKDG